MNLSRVSRGTAARDAGTPAGSPRAPMCRRPHRIPPTGSITPSDQHGCGVGVCLPRCTRLARRAVGTLTGGDRRVGNGCTGTGGAGSGAGAGPVRGRDGRRRVGRGRPPSRFRPRARGNDLPGARPRSADRAAPPPRPACCGRSAGACPYAVPTAAPCLVPCLVPCPVPWVFRPVWIYAPSPPMPVAPVGGGSWDTRYGSCGAQVGRTTSKCRAPGFFLSAPARRRLRRLRRRRPPPSCGAGDTRTGSSNDHLGHTPCKCAGGHPTPTPPGELPPTDPIRHSLDARSKHVRGTRTGSSNDHLGHTPCNDGMPGLRLPMNWNWNSNWNWN